jgi:hypothetical protein
VRYRAAVIDICVREPVLKLEDRRSIGRNLRICHTCVRILEEL